MSRDIVCKKKTPRLKNFNVQIDPRETNIGTRLDRAYTVLRQHASLRRPEVAKLRESAKVESYGEERRGRANDDLPLMRLMAAHDAARVRGPRSRATRCTVVITPMVDPLARCKHHTTGICQRDISSTRRCHGATRSRHCSRECRRCTITRARNGRAANYFDATTPLSRALHERDEG